MLGFYALGQLALGEGGVSTATLITAAAGSFTLSGQAISVTLPMLADVGTFTLSGQSAGLPTVLPSNAGSFTLAGQNAGLNASYFIGATPYQDGERSFFGFSALGASALGQGSQSSTGLTFSVAWQEASSVQSLAANAGAFVLSGQDSRLIEGYVLSTLAGQYAMTGNDALFTVTMPAAAGSFVLTSSAIDLVRPIGKIRAFPRVGRRSISASPTGRGGIRIRAYGG